MSNLPFGFSPGNGDDEGGRANDPFSAMFGAAGANPADLGAALHRFADLMSWQGGPVNWDLAKEGALTAAGADDPGTSPTDTARIREAVELADLWLNEATTLPSGVTSVEAWSRRRWVEATQPAWAQLCDPVAARVVEAMGSAMPAEMAPMAGPLMGMMRTVGGMMFGAQVGSALGSLAAEVVSSTDVGLPLGPGGRAALLPANVAAFGKGLEIPADEVRLFLAAREAAHMRLFSHVPWLRGHLFAAVEAYAKGIRVDTDALESAVRDLNPQDPEALQQALSGGMFEPQETPEQKAALRRLETALALVEGWVDEVVDAATRGKLPSSTALRETVRRRRATGGPAEQTFATLVGLELRPRRLREAATLWRSLAEIRGIEGRDALWSHPDLLPTGDDLEDPAAFATGAAALDISSLTDLPPQETPGESSGEAHGDAPGEDEQPEA
ncbi:MAG: zinc-dependent metalloprotease [Actinomycetota bacterium]|nr:zinc-dependent metalloprotease [Actinomycetota bacterium]